MLFYDPGLDSQRDTSTTHHWFGHISLPDAKGKQCRPQLLLKECQSHTAGKAYEMEKVFVAIFKKIQWVKDIHFFSGGKE